MLAGAEKGVEGVLCAKGSGVSRKRRDSCRRHDCQQDKIPVIGARIAEKIYQKQILVHEEERFFGWDFIKPAVYFVL